MTRCIYNSNFKLRADKSVSLQFDNKIEMPTSTKLHGNTLPLWIKFVHEELREGDAHINWHAADI